MALDGESLMRWRVDPQCRCRDCSPGLYAHCCTCHELLYRYTFSPHYCVGLFGDRLPGYVKPEKFFPVCTHPERRRS